MYVQSVVAGAGKFWTSCFSSFLIFIYYFPVTSMSNIPVVKHSSIDQSFESQLKVFSISVLPKNESFYLKLKERKEKECKKKMREKKRSLSSLSSFSNLFLMMLMKNQFVRLLGKSTHLTWWHHTAVLAITVLPAPYTRILFASCNLSLPPICQQTK